MRQFCIREEGQDLVEYALLVALVAVVAIASLQQLSTTIGNIWDVITNRLAS